MEMSPSKRLFIKEIFFENMCSVPRHGAVYFLSIYQDRPQLVSLQESCTRRMGETDNKKTDEAVKNCIKCFEGKKGCETDNR